MESPVYQYYSCISYFGHVCLKLNPVLIYLLTDKCATHSSKNCFFDNHPLEYICYASIATKNIYFSYSAGIDFIRQNLTSAVPSKVDPRAVRVNDASLSHPFYYTLYLTSLTL